MLNRHAILVVDDDHLQLQLYANFLGEKGFEVLVAKNGQEGLDIALEHKPAIIVADYRMPGISGLKFCEAIREDPDLKNAILLIFTAHDCTDEEVDLFHDIPDGWIRKNEGIEQLVDQVLNWAKLLD